MRNKEEIFNATEQFVEELISIHKIMRKDKTNILISFTTIERDGKIVDEYNIEGAWSPETKEDSIRDIPSYMG